MSNGQAGGVPPYSPTAEKAVIGSILLNNGALAEVKSIVDPHDFYVEAHRYVYQAMITMGVQNTPIDHVTLGTHLAKRDELAKIGGAMGLDDLTSAVSTSANAVHYAKIVQAKSSRRKMIVAARQVIDDAYEEKDDDRLDRSLKTLVEASKDTGGGQMPHSLLALGDAVLEGYKKIKDGFSGIPLPWESLNNMTMGMWAGTVTMFVARPGVGKCLRLDTLSYIPTTGQYKTIEQIVKDKDDVLTRKSDGSIVPVTPDAWLDMGTKECIRVEFDSGREMSQTPEHPMMTVDGWKRTDELSVGDYIEAVGIVPEPTEAISVRDEESTLIGMMLADGGVTQHQPSFTKGDRVIVEHVGKCCRVYDSELVQMTRGKDDDRYRINGVNFWKNWDGWGCDRSLSKNKTIPDRVFQYDNKSLAKFLGAFWSCDGSFPHIKGKNGRKDAWTAEVGLASKTLLEQLQRLFLRFGIHGRIRYKAVKLKGKVFDSWVYRVHSTSHDKFKKHIPMIGGKAESARHLENAINPNKDNIPVTPKLKVELLRIVNQFDDGARTARYDTMSAELGMTTRISVNKLYRRNTVSRRIFNAFIDAFDAEHLRHLTVNHWDKIVSIKNDGVHRVFDLTVMDGHAFVANDMVVHNTFLGILAAKHAYSKGHKVLLFSPEMLKEEIAERYFVLESGVSYDKVIKGALSDLQYPQLKNAVDRLREEKGLYILDRRDLLNRRNMEAAMRACEPELVCVDSIYSLKFKGDRRERAIAGIEWMIDASIEHNAAFCAFAQQNRGAELDEKKGGGSRLGTIALADEIAQDCHAAFALEQDRDMRDDRILRIKPLKVRRGSWGEDVEINWDFDKQIHDEIKREKKDDFDDGYDDDVPF